VSDRVRIKRYITREVPYNLEEDQERLSVAQEGDTAPFEYLMRDGEVEAVRYSCPCGCGMVVMLRCTNSRQRRKVGQHPQDAGLHLWDARSEGRLINPSVNHLGGCKSHYFLNGDGTVTWC